MSTNSWLTTMSLEAAGRHARLSSGFQMPDKSGLPSAARGAGAPRSTAPVFVRGTPAVGYLTHCACNGSTTQIDKPMTRDTAVAAFIAAILAFFISVAALRPAHLTVV